ncbi:MAG: ferritin-like domain-containing protein [Pseudonocardia sp.]|nr:ferritin-like domain-containing protein [Pseudonocardia sp.]
MANTPAVVAQLRALARLTRAEIQIARTRVAQARTDAVRRELTENGDDAVRRAERIAEALRGLDAVPDVVAPVVGRAAALVKSTVEQAQPLDEALLGDLALEHQLLDRARYLLALTDRDGPASVHRLAEQLVAAHTATVDWLTTVLAEDALGGPTALRPTPLQVVTGGVTRAVRLPTRLTVDGVNRAAHEVSRARADARRRVGGVARLVGRFTSDTREVVTTGVDAALERAEDVARDGDDHDTTTAVPRIRRELGVPSADELPVRRYDELSVQQAVGEVRKLRSPDDLQAVIRYEEQHKNRSGIVSAARTRFAAVAKDVVGV